MLDEWGVVGLVLTTIYVWRLADLGVDFLRHAAGDRFKRVIGIFMILWGAGETFLLVVDRVLRYTSRPPHMIFEGASIYPEFYVIASMLSFLALGAVVYYVSTITWKNPLRYIPVVVTLLPVVTGPFVLIGTLDVSSFRYVDYVATTGALAFPFEYIYIGLKFGGELRKKAFYISGGMIVLFLGKTLQANVVTIPLYHIYGFAFLEMFVALTPLVLIAGTVLIEIGYGV